MPLFKRASPSLPSAFSVQPSEKWLDADGLWSAFNLEVGNGPGRGQNFLVVPSTSNPTTWLPDDKLCKLAKAPANCSLTRGVGLFNGNQSAGYDDSTSSSSTGTGPLGLEYFNRGGSYPAEILYGVKYGNFGGILGEDILYMSSSTAPITTHSSSGRVPIYAYSNDRYYLPSLGLGAGIHKSSASQLMNSTLLNMVDAGAIPSLSWGYTAGAYYGEHPYLYNSSLCPRRHVVYTLLQVFLLSQCKTNYAADKFRRASLVIGGYDQARIQGQPAQFKFLTGSTAGSELLVSVTSIGIQYKNNSSPASTPPLIFDAVVDSTLPYLFLPNTTCDWLRERLHLEYDAATGLYTIDSQTLESNKDNIASFTVTIGSTQENSTNFSAIALVITFPYKAFDAKPVWTWDLPNSTIFPIRRAQSDTAVLGRPFFQEAYVSADYTHMVFNISQTTQQKDLTNTPDIISIFNATVQAELNQHSSGLSKGAIAGIAVGGAGALVIAALVLWFCWWKKREKKQPKTDKETQLQDVEEHFHSPVSPGAETLDRRNTFESMSSSLTELSGVGLAHRPSLRNNRGVSQISELSSGSDETYDAAGRTRSGTLGAIPELLMSEKSDAAEFERLEAERRQREAMIPVELEGEGHMLRTPR
jgi:hypothetical protein